MPTKEAEPKSKEVYLVDELPAGTQAIGKLAANSGVDIGDVTLTASENHIGQIAQGGIVVDVAPTTQAAAYSAGDVLFDSTAVAGAVRVSGGKSVLESVTLIDLDDNTAAVIDLYFTRANQSFGALNGAPDIDDTEVLDVIGWVSLLAADFKDLGGVKVASVKNVGLVVQPTTGTSIWVAGVCAGTPTQTAAGIKLRLGFRFL